MGPDSRKMPSVLQITENTCRGITICVQLLLSMINAFKKKKKDPFDHI